MMSALSGLRATQSGMDVVSNNVANAGSPNYTRKTLLNEQQVVGGDAVGVKSGDISRVLDKMVQRQLWTETAGGTYTSTRSDYVSRLDSLFGTPGDTSALDAVFNTFTQSIQDLATSPDGVSARSQVLNNARVMAQQLNGASTDIQSLRSAAEDAIGSAVNDVNDALQNIKKLSDQIDKTGALGTSAALLDERDGYISKLSSLMDIKVVPNGNNKVSIFTNAGGLLFDGMPATLSFDSHGELGPKALYNSDPTKSGVGTITLTATNGTKTDMLSSGLIRSGKIAALVDLRDKTLVEAQTQLDTIAAQMSTALSNKIVDGTPATSGAQTGFTLDLAGSQPGNPLTVSTTSSGVSRQTVFVEVSPTTTLPLPASASGGSTNVKVVGYTGGAAGAAAAMSTELGAGFTVSSSGTTVTVLDDGASSTTDVTGLSASITNTSVTGNGSELPLFVDGGGSGGVPYTGSFDNGSQRTGFAARIAVNQQVLADPSTLVQYNTGILSGDATRPQLLLDRLTKTQFSMPADTGIGGSARAFTGTVSAFTQSVVATQGRNQETAKNIDDGQQIVVNALADKFKATAGVNIDNEMANLLQLQNAYAANARVMSTIKDMLTALMNM
jgi:flagellar hook-associated protein 1 FlgK